MTMKINQGTLDDWLANFDSFNYDFRRFCFEQFRAFGVSSSFIPNVLNQIHAKWVADCGMWLNAEASEDTKQLSQTKIVALLLFNLISEAFLGNFHDHEYAEEDKFEFKGSEIDREAARRDLVDAREAVLSLDFCVSIIAWHEINRDQRKVPYRNPITFDVRHDILSYLLAGAADRKALYLILHALFL